MTSEEKLGFREWQPHYEKQQEADRLKVDHVVDTVGQLSGVVSRMSAVVETVAENQKGMFTRLNRPWQWGVVVAGFMMVFSMSGMFGVMATLIVNPIVDSINHGAEMHSQDIKRVEVAHARDVERDLQLHMWFRETIASQEVETGKLQVKIEFLELMEERVNGRIHASALGVNP